MYVCMYIYIYIYMLFIHFLLWFLFILQPPWCTLYFMTTCLYYVHTYVTRVSTLHACASFCDSPLESPARSFLLVAALHALMQGMRCMHCIHCVRCNYVLHALHALHSSYALQFCNQHTTRCDATRCNAMRHAVTMCKTWRAEARPHVCTRGSFLIRSQRGHPGVVLLPPVISNSANH